MYICLPEITEEYDIKWMTGLLCTKCLMNGMHSLYILSYYFINDAEVCRDIVSDAFVVFVGVSYVKDRESDGVKLILYTNSFVHVVIVLLFASKNIP